MSNEKKLNDFISKKYIKYLFLLIIIFFIYQKYNLLILVTILFFFVLFNIDFKKKLKNTELLDKYNECKKKFINFLKDFKETLIGEENMKEKFSNNSYDVIPYEKDILEIEKELIKDEKKDIEKIEELEELEKKENEPFKKEVNEIKELYENIKMEINRLGS